MTGQGPALKPDSDRGERIRERRRALAITQAQLAADVGIDTRNVREWESGRAGIARERLELLANALGVDPTWLGAPELVEPLTVLREQLAEARAAGDDFADAWRHAVATALVGHRPSDLHTWTTVLTATAPAWERAFNRRPATRGELAAVALLPDATDHAGLEVGTLAA